VNSTESRSPVTLPPVTLTPEEAASVAVALAAQPDGPYSAAGRGALAKIVEALEPDPLRRAQLLTAADRVSPRSAAHPAGRRRPAGADQPRPPRLVVIPGGLA
jgi:predicted DNA-binding transcriptional regulator YafY